LLASCVCATRLLGVLIPMPGWLEARLPGHGYARTGGGVLQRVEPDRESLW
jgi:hypothetical protein